MYKTFHKQLLTPTMFRLTQGSLAPKNQKKEVGEKKLMRNPRLCKKKKPTDFAVLVLRCRRLNRRDRAFYLLFVGKLLGDTWTGVCPEVVASLRVDAHM